MALHRKFILTSFVLLWAFLHLSVSAASSPSAAEQGVLRGRVIREVEDNAWALAADGQGRIYCSVEKGVMVFDGETWTLLPLPEAGEIRGLAVDSTGRVWVGSETELGYFTPTADGSFRFRSIRALLPNASFDYGKLWAVHVVDDAIFFVADQQVMRWRNDKFTCWPLPSVRRLFSSQSRTQLYVHIRGDSGLWQFSAHDAQPTLLAGDAVIFPLIEGAGIINVLPAADGGQFLFTTTKGVFRLDAHGQLAPAGWPTQGLLKSTQIEDVHQLADGRFAIATWRAGVVLTDAQGQLVAHIDKATGGLPDNRINRVLASSDRRLWIATQRGLAEWDLSPAVTYFGDHNGLVGNVSGFVRYLGDLYLTTDLNFLKLLPAADDAATARLAPIENKMRRQSYISQPEVHGRRLLYAGYPGVEFFEDGKFDPPPSLLLWVEGNRLAGATGYAHIGVDRMAATTPVGVFGFKSKETQWEIFSHTPLLQGRQVIAEPGQNASMIVRTFPDELWRITLPKPQTGATPPGGIQCLLPRELARKIFQVFPQSGNVYAYTLNGTWKLEPGSATFRQIEPARTDPWIWAGGILGTEVGWKLRTHPLPSDAMPGTPPCYALHRAHPDPVVGWKEDLDPCLLLNDVGSFLAGFAEGDGVLWIAGNRGIARVLTTAVPAKAESIPHRPLWRFVRSQGQLLPCDGSAPLALAAKSNLNIGWSAPQADRFLPNFFQSRLEGIDKTWTTPSPENERLIERLRPGSYTLSVRSVSLLGMVSQERSLTFTIAPTWYQTWPAFTAGLGLVGVSLYGFIVLRTRQLRSRQRGLQEAVLRRTQELRATTEVLQQATHAKTEFISTISHELRTPLVGVRMMADLLLRSPLESDDRDRVAKLRGGLTYLQTMLDDTLDLSRIELGIVLYRLSRFQLGKLVRDTLSIFEPLAASKDLACLTQIGERENSWYCGEATHLQRVLVNFLSNAIKFTPHGTITVNVSLAPTGPASFETLRFTVSDTGPGVAPDVQDRIFRAFVRHRDPQKHSGTTSTGLGLALCQKLADLSGGKIGFASKPDGASFWVDWPLLPASPDQDDTAIGERDLSKLRILVVEVNANQLESMDMLLQELGVFAVTARSFAEAEQQMSKRHFDAVLVDYNLGSATGMDLIAHARTATGFKPSAPRFHLMTAHGSEDIRTSALQAGFSGFHIKPISLPALYGLLRESLPPDASR